MSRQFKGTCRIGVDAGGCPFIERCQIRDRQIRFDPLKDSLNLDSTGNIKMTDIDGGVERRYNVLFLETKTAGVQITKAQRMLLQRLTHPLVRIHALQVDLGNPVDWETARRMRFFSNGKVLPFKECDFDMVKARILAWREWAETVERPF